MRLNWFQEKINILKVDHIFFSLWTLANLQRYSMSKILLFKFIIIIPELTIFQLKKVVSSFVKKI